MGNSTTPDAIIESLYQGTIDAEAWRTALLDLAKAVNGSGLCLISWLPHSGRLLRDEIVGIDTTAFGRYRTEWAGKDIRVPAGLSADELEPITESVILPEGSWEQSEVFNEFLRFQDTSYLLAAWLQKGTPIHTSISIQGPLDRGPFSCEDVNWVRPILPHLKRALAIRERIERANLKADALRSAFDQTAFGVMILDELGQLLDASAMAIEVLLGTGALVRRSPGAYVLIGATASKIRELVGSELQSGGLTDGVIKVPRARGRPVCLTLAPLPQYGGVWLSATPRWVVIVTDPDRTERATVPQVMSHLGLTEREAEITLALCMGYRTAEVADRLSISDHTVRSHLKAIFAKTGAHTQADLVRLTVTSPIWPNSNRPA